MKSQKEFNQNQNYIVNHQILIDSTENFKRDYKEKENKIRVLFPNNLI